MIVIWVLAAFFSGAIPYSVWIGRRVMGVDIRQVGDGNPGATNVLRAGGKGWGALAMLLDSLKATVPVGLAYFAAGFRGIEMFVIALAPIAGHAFSPFLGFRGGKAVAATFGVWVGLTIWEAPTVLGIMLTYWFLGLRSSGWAVMFALASLLLYLLLAWNDPLLLSIALGNTAILAYKHRAELSPSSILLHRSIQQT